MRKLLSTGVRKETAKFYFTFKSNTIFLAVCVVVDISKRNKGTRIGYSGWIKVLC